jgi:acetylornithine/N-succinyldiaminopimelate aminotransferase
MALSDLQELDHRFVMGTYARQPVEFVRGSGSWLFDANGRQYLDFFAGVAVVQIGHCHPQLVEAASAQLGQLIHTSNHYYTEPSMRLAMRLSQNSLGGKVFFCNSGTEANECALKLARRHKPGGEVVVLEGAFHGRTYGSLSATPQRDKQSPFAPLVPGFQSVDRDDPQGLAAAVSDRTAAVVCEPVQGESGVHPISAEMLETARSACDRHDCLLVFDEIQCGMGRTGSLWAFEQLGVVPDLMTTAKGLGGGLPIGACVSSPATSELFETGDHGSTFAGDPVPAAAANAVLDVVSDKDFLAEVARKGKKLKAGLAELGFVGVRGLGLMLACNTDGAPEFARRALLEQNLVINATGPDTVRLTPPLTVTDTEIDDALTRIAALL